MSIWCSDTTTGFDDGAESQASGMSDIPVGGQVRSYADGFSNHHPNTAGTHEHPACVGLDSIAPWCVPGHDQTRDLDWRCSACATVHDYPECGPWVRLDLYSPGALTWWTLDDLPNPQPAPIHASVVLDEHAARALAANLLAWADRPKVYPVEAQQEPA
jgi:hypothetical protein